MTLLRDPARLLRLFVLVFGVLLLVVSSAFIIGETWHSPGETLAQPVETAGRFQGADAQAFAQGFRDIEQKFVSPTPTPKPTATPEATPTQAPQAPPASVPEQPQSPSSPPAQQPSAPPPAQQGCPTQGMSGFGLALFNAINSERANAGLSQLAANGCIVYVAQIRSNDMANLGYFSHTSPSGQTAFSLLSYYGIPYGWAGENLARNNYPDGETVAVAIRDLMASQSHRDNILNVHYTQMGVAVAIDGAGMKYFTMVFTGPA